jgi:hypothetical protein
MLRQRYLFEGTPTDEANVIFARLGEATWVRFFFDSGVFFWREVTVPESPPAEGPNNWPLVPVALPSTRGAVIAVRFIGTAGDGRRVASLEFQGGLRVELQNERDNNTLLVTDA